MKKILKSQILVKDAELVAVRLDEKDVYTIINQTNHKQNEILKLKDVDQEKLRMVVRL